MGLLGWVGADRRATEDCAGERPAHCRLQRGSWVERYAGAHLYKVFRHAGRELEYSVQFFFLAEWIAAVAGSERRVARISLDRGLLIGSEGDLDGQPRHPRRQLHLHEFERHGTVRGVERVRAQQRGWSYKLER